MAGVTRTDTDGAQQAIETHPRSHDSPVAQNNGHSAVDISANIVLFGETGVGKSAVINLIAGQELALTSNDALGCTFQHKRYPIQIDTAPCALWDTAGLDEAPQGTVPARVAETHLTELMRGLMHSGGIHLIIYCIRGRRLTETLKRNYNLFYVTICRRKVPIALVVTGLEHQEGGMETWWTANEATLLRSGMHFDAHACVTTVTSENSIIQQRRSDSRERLFELIKKFTVLRAWNADLSTISRVIPSAVREPSFMDTLGNTTITRKVVVCDSFAALLPGTTAVWIRSTVRIGNREYEFLRVDKHDLQTNGIPESITDAGALVFYTSTLVADCISPEDIDALKKFHDLAGGQLCPVIVVLQGCNDEQVARKCYIEVTSRHSDIRPSFVSLPGTDATQVELDEMIERLCIENVEVKAHSIRRYIGRLFSLFFR